MEEVIVLSSDNEDSSSSSSSPSSASDMEIDPIEIEHNTTEQFVPKDNQTLEKIYLKAVIPLTAFLEPMTDFEHWENMKCNNYRKARVHTTINQIYGSPNEQRNYRDLKARVNLKSVKRNSNTSVLSGVASVIDPCELNSGDFSFAFHFCDCVLRNGKWWVVAETRRFRLKFTKYPTISVIIFYTARLQLTSAIESVTQRAATLSRAKIPIDWLDCNVRLGASVRSQAAHVIDDYWAG
uniref:Uncharacterized protein n=1 Tax=Glossina pallidipes TaxID=7398 RepID=A0A1B0A410_GLOPL